MFSKFFVFFIYHLLMLFKTVCVALHVQEKFLSSGVVNPALVKYISICKCAIPCSLDNDAQSWHIGTLHVTYFELRVACCALHMCACALDNDGQYWHKKIIWGQGDGGCGR